MGHRIANRMIDEWISNLPGLKHFAFRHLIVAEKTFLATTINKRILHGRSSALSELSIRSTPIL